MDQMLKERYLEDFHAGDRFRSSAIQINAEEIVEFARKFDPQPFHTDGIAARDSAFGGLVASGWHTASITMRLLAQSEIRVAGGLIGMGVEQLRWPAPVRPGDELHVETEVLDARVSQSHPKHGIVRVRTRTLNQAGIEVQTMLTSLWVPRRG